jgi:hypothetical protein
MFGEVFNGGKRGSQGTTLSQAEITLNLTGVHASLLVGVNWDRRGTNTTII